MDTDFFTPLPLAIDAQTKAISASTPSTTDPLLAAELARLNATHRALQQLDPPQLVVPPAPAQIGPKRSQQIAKMRETAAAALAKKSGKDALPAPSTPSTATTATATTPAPASEPTKLFTLALDMAAQRPEWEAAGLRREELAALYRGRAEAYAAIRAWPDALVDARASLECKGKANPAALARAGRALLEMQRGDEARTLLAPVVAEDVAGVEAARQQVANIPANHPQKGQAQEQVKAFERDVDELKGVARELGIKV